MKLTISDKAPSFTAPDQNNKVHKLSDYKGKWVLLYFYPKDNTPGCIREACAIRDNYSAFKKIKAVVLGVSKDSVKSHDKFATKYELPFIILSDEDKEIIKAYGVWQKKKLAGKEYMGVVRTSFLINPKGKIVKIYEKVNPVEHAGEVLLDLHELVK